MSSMVTDLEGVFPFVRELRTAMRLGRLPQLSTNRFRLATIRLHSARAAAPALPSRQRPSAAEVPAHWECVADSDTMRKRS
jgi:hypothetical protein